MLSIFSKGCALDAELEIPFTLTISTSDSGSFSIPLDSATTYDILVKWGDGTETSFSGLGITLSNTYSVGGSYQVEVYGAFPKITFEETGGSDSIISVDAFGSRGWSPDGMSRMFTDCDTIVSVTSGKVSMYGVTTMRAIFALCSDFVNSDFSGIDTSTVQDFRWAFFQCPATEPYDLSYFDTSSATSMRQMFQGSANLDQDVSHFNISSLTTADSMMSDTSFSTANYDLLLINWAAQAPNIQMNVPLGVGSTQHTAGGAAEAAHDVLTDTYGWTITDGGGI